MNYKPRHGIVKVKLCGMNVLVPTREASAYCTTIQMLPTLWNATWEAFGRGTTIEKSVNVHVMLTKRTPEECRQRIEAFCKSMVEKGFFVEVLDEETESEAEQNCPPDQS